MNEMVSSLQFTFPSTHLEKEFPRSINSILMFPVSQTRYQMLSVKPEWLDLFGQCVTNQHFILNKEKSLLDTFLVDARAFWLSKGKGVVRSGKWVQTDHNGIDYTFEAMASILHNKPVLLVKRIAESQQGIGRIHQSAVEKETCRERIDGLNSRDNFTGLYSRLGFLLHAEELLMIARCQQQPVTIACFGLDYMRPLSDKSTHNANNQHVSIVTDVLKKGLRKTDLLGRVGDDVFLALIPTMKSEQTIFLNARLNQLIGHWNAINGPNTQISFSTGFSNDDDMLQPLAQLVSQADINMYKNQQNKYQVAMAS